MNTRSLGFVERLGIAVLLIGVGMGAIQVPSLAQKPTAYASFKPGAVWLANDGLPH